jgi:sortase (surface protein transpeptidase)
VFAALIGFGGSSTRDNAAQTAPPPSSKPSTFAFPQATVTALAPHASSASPSARPSKPSSRSTGIGTKDASIGSLRQTVRDRPVRIRIPALKVNAMIIPVGVTASGALNVPTNVTQAAWYQAGAAPGQPGTAIIAAHVDFNGKLGLFNGLHSLSKGTPVYVTDAGGKTRLFKTTVGKLAPKSDPTTVQALAAASASPGKSRLALITCGGDLNTAKHSYYDNYVLLAQP